MWYWAATEGYASVIHKQVRKNVRKREEQVEVQNIPGTAKLNMIQDNLDVTVAEAALAVVWSMGNCSECVGLCVPCVEFQFLFV